ncbi:YraN family protein [Agromyces sp. SYSU T0242]|uniref:YraN family protein n=1 Tax=Agromyces litoreus TaxID=3158561 RepID=UPI0033959DE6
MAHNTELGRRGERLAAEHLEARGMRVLERNWRCRHGEIDLVVRDGDETVFVEVKTRSGDGYGHPFEAITARKLARLRRLALAWCHERGARSGRIRIDAVAVFAPATEPAIVEHLRGVA